MVEWYCYICQMQFLNIYPFRNVLSFENFSALNLRISKPGKNFCLQNFIKLNMKLSQHIKMHPLYGVT